MAPPASEAPRPAALWQALLRPSRARAEMALRLAAICTLTVYVTEYYGTPEPALTAYLVFFLNRPDRTTSLILNLAFLVIITIVIALIFPIAAAVVDAPGWRVAAMALVSILFLFLGSASKLKPIAPIVALIIVYALDLLGFTPSGELATRALLYAWLFVAIPAAVSFAVNLLAAPSPRSLAERALAARLRAAAAVLRGADEAERREFEACRDAGVGEILQWLHLAGVEHILSAAVRKRLEAAALSTSTILFLAGTIADEAPGPDEWTREAAALLDAMADAFRQGGYPVDIALAPPAAEAVGPAAMLGKDLSDVLARFTAEAEPAAAPPAPKSGFLLPDAFTNPAHIQYALKATAAAITCYFLYVLLDWPGIHTCLITCYIVALGTAAETIEKLGLRIVGCLAGAVAGIAAIVWIIPAFDTVSGLLAIVFAGGLLGAWVAAGSPRIAYAGFQFTFAFFLCVVQGSGPAFDLTIARDRVIGILIGNLVTFLFFTQLWPLSLKRRVEAGFAGLLAELAAAGGLPRAARRLRLPALQARLATLADELALLIYEPASLRPSPAWLGARRRALAAAASLQAPLVVDDDPRFWAGIGRRIGALAAPEDGAASSAHPRLAPANPLQHKARAQVIEMETALASNT